MNILRTFRCDHSNPRRAVGYILGFKDEDADLAETAIRCVIRRQLWASKPHPFVLPSELVATSTEEVTTYTYRRPSTPKRS